MINCAAADRGARMESRARRSLRADKYQCRQRKGARLNPSRLSEAYELRLFGRSVQKPVRTNPSSLNEANEPTWEIRGETCPTTMTIAASATRGCLSCRVRGRAQNCNVRSYVTSVLRHSQTLTQALIVWLLSILSPLTFWSLYTGPTKKR